MRFDPDNPELAAAIVDGAIAAGVNYIETTRIYIQGRCQHLTALGLKGRSRGLIVSGKAAVREDTTEESFRKEIDLQMQILGVDYLEFFQVGWFSLDALPWLTKPGGALDALNKARSEGIIGHIGFTGHDDPDSFTKLIETGLFDSLTIIYNIVNRSYAPTIKRAGELGVGVIVMCPVGGGVLAGPAPRIQQLIPGGAKTTAAAALQFVLANPDVSCACSGMITLDELRENLETANAFKGASAKDHARMDAILDEMAALGQSFCTACGYCMECPQGVDIPRNFRLYNYARVYGMTEWARSRYLAMAESKRAAACTRCGECEPKCPNKIPVMDRLGEIEELLGLS
jgi:predicted aldo/keto reductase-like oxidoreductase